jgi:hypothetical protein
MLLYVQAFWQLLRFHYWISGRNFPLLYQHVRDYPRFASQVSPEIIEHACSAVERLCMWYPKQVPCLQRSAATTCLLRNYGVEAKMVIGVQHLPFKAHAWVEVDGRVVNDLPYTREMYTTLDCC